MAERFTVSDSQPTYSLEGKLLVATPQWQDENFQRSVCLVVHHDSQGAVGIVLNREFALDAEQIWQHLGGEQFDLREDMLHLGGPESGPVIALHNVDEMAEFETGDGVFMAAQIQTLQSLVKNSLSSLESSCELKIIIGQADWEAGQLEQQMRDGCWLPIEVTPEIVFEEPSLMWPRAMAEVGNSFVRAITGAKPTRDALLN